MNFVWLMGHLGADAETRFTSGGTKVTTLRVAVNDRRQGKDETTWYRVTIWGDRYDKMLPYLTKGSAIVVGGPMRKPEIYTDKNGQPQLSSIEITAEHLSFSPFGRSDKNATQQQGYAAPAAPAFGNAAPSAAPGAMGAFPAFPADQMDEGGDFSFSGEAMAPAESDNGMPF